MANIVTLYDKANDVQQNIKGQMVTCHLHMATILCVAFPSGDIHGSDTNPMLSKSVGMGTGYTRSTNEFLIFSL